ncbi:MAG: DUF4249 domain-containing protein [Flavobacteriales bacterium]|nr:DUF4249 domain-containing protein [Flavobacteriales bacterium]
MRVSNIFIFLVLLVTFSSCEDKIDLDLEDGKIQLVVDGFITNDSSIQTIRLTKTAAYFSNIETPFENDAVVRVLGPNNKVFNFISDGIGNFSYNPQMSGPLDSTNFSYQLEIDYKGETYQALSVLNPIPSIDSMTYAFEEEELGAEEGYYTQFYARDFAGRKDYYWIRSFRNGTNVYEEDRTFLILSEDAAFGGDGADGFVFILPLRAAITNQEDPFKLGDTSSVELFSLNSAPYQFLDQIITNSGNDGLFATPSANYRSNILTMAGNPQEEVLGVFSLSAISKFEIVIQ